MSPSLTKSLVSLCESTWVHQRPIATSATLLLRLTVSTTKSSVNVSPNFIGLTAIELDETQEYEFGGSPTNKYLKVKIGDEDRIVEMKVGQLPTVSIHF